MFKPRFARLVESGAKCQTVRPIPKRMPMAGDQISLREWTGKPYRSKQRILLESVIAGVEPIKFSDTGRELLICLAGQSLSPEEVNSFAERDGFKDGVEMFHWFETEHGLPFDGVLIQWEAKA